MESEVISKLYLELSQIVPESTRTARELDLEARVRMLEEEREAAIDALNEYGHAGGADSLDYHIRSVIDDIMEAPDGE